MYANRREFELEVVSGFEQDNEAIAQPFSPSALQPFAAPRLAPAAQALLAAQIVCCVGQHSFSTAC
jgi:hypothetical protein